MHQPITVSLFVVSFVFSACELGTGGEATVVVSGGKAAELLSGGQAAELDDILRRQETAKLELMQRAQHRTQHLRDLERLKQRWRETHGDKPLPPPKATATSVAEAIRLPETAALGMEKKLAAARGNQSELVRLHLITAEVDSLIAQIEGVKAGLTTP